MGDDWSLEICRDDPHKCLLKMLDTWLERVHPPASWPTIVAAVEILGEEQLGRENSGTSIVMSQFGTTSSTVHA